MFIQQISIFIENKPGHLADVVDVLAQNQIDISALSLADTSDFGILRLIVDQPDLAYRVLREHGLVVKLTDVIAVAMDDQPGGLASILQYVSASGNSIEYMYAFVGKQAGKAVVVMRVRDPEAVVSALEKDAVTIIDAREIYRL